MKNKLHYVLIALLLLQISAFAQTAEMGVPTESQTDTSTNPAQSVLVACRKEGFVFQDGQLILGTENGLFSHLYLIHNMSNYEQLLLTHPTNTAMSAGWDSRVDQGQWSAITINRPNFVVNCFGRRPGAIGYVDCSSVLEVCAYTNANTGEDGNYWRSENKSLFDTMSSLRSNSVTVPQSPFNQ